MFPIYLKIRVAEGGHHSGALEEYVSTCNSKNDIARIGMRERWIHKLMKSSLKSIEEAVLAGKNYSQVIDSYTWFEVAVTNKSGAASFEKRRKEQEAKISAEHAQEEKRKNKIRAEALKKLSPEEIEVLGLKK